MRIQLILLSALLASCSGLSLPSFTTHKIDIRQGNLITPEMRDKLKLGMSRAAVRSVMGTPLINDPFHPNRWDYAYRLERGGKLIEQQHMTLVFDNDRLVRIDDSQMPPLLVTVEPAPHSPEPTQPDSSPVQQNSPPAQ
ncbi:MAG: outer membrane protein assembly factor BamE [Pseudomonadota bacterium]